MMPNVMQVASTDYHWQPILDARNEWTQESVMLENADADADADTKHNSIAVFTLGDIDFNFICLNSTFDVNIKI